MTAADSLSASSTITVTIKVTNVDEMPELEGEAPEEYAENGTGAVATFTATDPEGESIVLGTSGRRDDMDDFSIENGVLSFKSAPDFEAPADAGTDNTYVYSHSPGIRRRSEARPLQKEVTIEVTNVDEPGTVTLSTLQPQVDVVIRATLDDPDNRGCGSGTITWQWYRGSSPITGATNGANTSSLAPPTLPRPVT